MGNALPASGDIMTQPTPSDDVRLALTYHEAAQTLGVSERTVWQLVRDRKLKACRIGRAVRIPVAAIEQFLAQ